jgi:sulfotransferase
MSVAPRIRTAIRGLIEGYYRDELAAGKTVFDKSRGWVAYIELIEEVLERPIKVICCVRDMRNVVASFERLYRTNQLTKADVGGEAYFECQTIEGRARQLLGHGAVVGLAINRIRDAFDRGLSNRIVVVRNCDLVADPASEIMRVSLAVGSQPFLCDPSNVRQATNEDDSVHGMKLHTVRPVVSGDGCTRWQEHLPQYVGDWIHESYPFMQELAGVTE